MKKAIKIMLLPISLWSACTGSSRVENAIPGVYVNHAESAYSVANDTLLIEAAPHSENSYLVTRKTGYRRVLKGQLQSPQYKAKTFTGTWDAQKQVLQVMPSGIMLTFQPGQRTLMIETSIYKKQ